MERLNFEYIKLDDLTPYENNAKRHAEEDISAIKSSINAFGMNDPIGVWGKKNIIVEGHGRFIALRELGYTEAPCIRLDKLTDEQRRGYALAHNKTAELAGWDFNKLEKELAELQRFEFDMSMFGFDECEINADDYGDEFSLPDGDKGEICQMTFTLHIEQAELIKYALSVVDDCAENFGNTNKNGNALYEVVRQWAEQRK